MMRRALLLSASLAFLPSLAAAVPRLLVVLSVDQMRADYLDRYSGKFTSGFKILFETGAVLTSARHDHVPTETAPGHAAILTGRTPDRHGIVGNDWFDRATGKETYCVSDEVHGKGPQNLEAYTLGDILKSKSPKSLVVSFSLKDRAAILMGGHKADAAVWWDKSKGEFVTSSYYARPAWLDDFNAKLKVPGGPLAGAPTTFFSKLLDTPKADRLLLDLVERAILEYPLGEDEATDILIVGFSGTDYVGHTYGPDSKQMSQQLLALDGEIGELLKVLGSKNGVAVALTADHAVMPLPESAWGKEVKAKRLMDKDLQAAAEKALQALQPAPGQNWVLGLSMPNLFVNRELARSRGLDWGLWLRQAAQAVGKLDGLSYAYVAGEVRAVAAPQAPIPGMADPRPVEQRFAAEHERSFFPGRSGDLLLLARENVLIAFDKTGTTHGTPYDYDARVPMIFWGADFNTGLYAAPARVTDFAPTLGAALGVPFEPARGSRVWTEVLMR